MGADSPEWGRIFARLRDGRGWSQMDLARLLKHLADWLGVVRVAGATAESIKRSVERWEAGGRPDERYWLLLAHAYATSNDGKAVLGPGSDFERLMLAFELTWILELGPFSKNAWSDLVAGRQKRWYSKGLARRLPDDRAVFAERSE